MDTKLTTRQWIFGAGAAFNVLAAQALAYGENLPQGMQWVAVVAFTLAAFFGGVYSPKPGASK